MSESSFLKGLNLGCGVLVAFGLVGVVLPIAACLVLGVAGSTPRGAPSAPRAAAPTPNEDAPPPRDPSTDCGSPTAANGLLGNPTPESWSQWECRPRAEAGEDWMRCLARREYALLPGRGCPGALRCCPPRSSDP